MSTIDRLLTGLPRPLTDTLAVGLALLTLLFVGALLAIVTYRANRRAGNGDGGTG